MQREAVRVVTTNETPTLLDIALDAWHHGLAVVPPAEDGTKRPDGPWQEYQRRLPTEDEIAAWYSIDRHGIGVVCGAVSGNLEMLEFEGRAVDDAIHDEFSELALAAGLTELVNRIFYGYCEWTPTGGLHLLYRIRDGAVTGNTKLARRPATVEELEANPDEKIKVLVETRGEGGYVIVAPSHGPVHPNDGEWHLHEGGFDRIATVTAEERDQLHRLARALDRMPTPPAPTDMPRTSIVQPADVGQRPGDAYNTQPHVASTTLLLLEHHGWARVFERSHGDHQDVHLRRPGKQIGTSAVLHMDAGTLVVFSTSTRFEAEEAYTPFAVYTVLEHAGDYSSAARALRPASSARSMADLVTQPSVTMTDGTGSNAEVERVDPLFLIEDIDVVARRVDSMPPPQFLARPVWPGDAHGIIGAENKAGKTWAILDMAVTVASGNSWLGQYPCDRPGPVLVFLGEGGERKMIRRARAVADCYHTRLEDLPIRVCHRVPQLSYEHHVEFVAAELEAHPAVLVVVDPLYLAAKGAKSSSLFEMATVLEPIQALCQKAQAALVVVHHWNKTGTGKDRDRFSGAGSAEWGRVLASVSVENKATDERGGSVVTLGWQFIGDEIPDIDIKLVRRVSALDIEDLASPMTYSVAPAVGGAVDVKPWDGPTQCMAAVLHYFQSYAPDEEISKGAMAERLRATGNSYRDTVVTEALERLAVDGVLGVRNGARNSRLFTLKTTHGTTDELL